MMEQWTIVIIDDCLEDRETYRRYLHQDNTYSYEILQEEYGENGLQLCKLVQPDVILLDFMLPDIDGLEFLNELQQQMGRSNLPVVMLTGQGNEAIAVQAMKSGASDYLVKGKTTAENLRLAIHNVIKRTHLQNLLERSEKRFRTSVETMLDCFAIFNSVRDASGQIVDFALEYFNAAADAYNCMRDKHVGCSLAQLPFHQETQLFKEYCQVVETSQPLLKEVLIYIENHHEHHLKKALDIRATKLDDGFVVAWRDISDRKRLEEERARSLTQEQAARTAAETANRAKDVFLAMVSHELRNPLTAILMYAQMLKTRKLDESKMTRALETIERNVKLQTQLIDDLLDVSRIVSGKLRLNMQVVDLSGVIEAAIETVHLAAQAKAIQIKFSVGASPKDVKQGEINLIANSPPFVLGDAIRLQQVIWNVLANAIKFTPPNGHVLVKLERNDNEVQVTISDTGCGISPEFLPHVFERFHQAETTTKQSGLGLGLAIVDHIVKLHGGAIDVVSPGIGQGTTFTIKLPQNRDRHKTQIKAERLTVI